MGIGLQIPGKGAGSVSTAGGAAARPFLLPLASVSFSEELFPICFLEFREGMGCFRKFRFPSKRIFSELHLRASVTPIPSPALSF